MKGATALRIELEHCHAKVALGEGAARSLAARIRAEGGTADAYRCPFGNGETHWHIGHPPTAKALKRIALAIRHQKGEVD